MPQTLYKEDGSEVQVMTDEEIAASIEQKVGETKQQYETRMKELEEDANPNWRDARQKMKDQADKIAALEAQGKTIDVNGNVVDLQAKVDPNELNKKIEETVSRSTFTIEKTRALAQFGEKSAVVGAYLDKLMTGESMTIDNLYKFIGDAAKLAEVESRPSTPYFSGLAPKKEEQKNDFSETPVGQELSARMNLNKYEKKK